MKVAVRVRPGARADSVGGSWEGPRGRALLVSVRARAVDGAANAAVVAALASAWGVRRGDVEIVSGLRGRDKVVEVAGDDVVVRAAVERLLGPS
ncbi:DUF167 domain-containing protein [Pseudonocardia sp. KRD-184]|uniref:UPF0235 protein I4I82_25650 n=1 Tax=Pseudonocardia oceani TaxID=2792013 RepID=A0ABS6UGI0_9PSEU|nr:DUF167 family protein [Pseudonocardia oceani]MBW0093797.1 DUF167 domain-containing protein [Pseudonocardia oceani]MBW0099190.1 DUF167 domain-containing protein [Pseudonocardia oceani]MBW0125369.1 DUF167 domain-containing protein [Pseudonocardia oceani]MBW0131038.1 DUF167 domain-containing protein [Pseudonocardia oceani]